MLLYFTYFILYSFLGFLLETGFSLVVTGRLISKKCLLFGLLCPVYGCGALAILGSTQSFRSSKIATFFVGALAATAVEYAVDFLYEHLFSMHIWNYAKMPFNINGRVCLLFSFFWGILSLALVYRLHPLIRKITPAIPKTLQAAVFFLFIADAAVTVLVLRRFGCKQALSISWLLQQRKKAV